MALLDRERNAIVLRIVYDGPAAAGKTTSVRSLGASLGRPIATPEEAGERTLFFDWLDYTGGLFEGFQLRCQVITVPGQALLARRRRQLVETADAVIYVAAPTVGTLPATLDALEELQRLLEAGADPVGIVLQANKRDLPDGIPLPDLRAELERLGLPVRIVESTATSGAGIREAFVFGVRLALDRVREQLRAGRLAVGRPEIDTPEDLYRRMQASEIQSPLPLASIVERPAALFSIDGHGAIVDAVARVAQGLVSTGAPSPPDEGVPSGMIWPPIEGRVLLAEATTARAEVTRIDGGWSSTTETGWQLHSPLASVFREPEDGRAALVQWARLHAQHARLLTPRRCVTLASDGSGAWRLWQLVRGRTTLRQRLSSALDSDDPEAVAESLIDASVRLAETHQSLVLSAAPIPITLDTVGVVGAETLYVGLLPEQGAAPRTSVEALVDTEMAPVVSDWRSRRDEVTRALGRARFRSRSDLHRTVIGRLLVLFTEESPDAAP